MPTAATQRQRYRSSGRVRMTRFIPWTLFTLLLALADGWLLQQLFAGGWYLPIFAPLALMVPLFAAIAGTVSKGECRSRAVALLLAVAAATVMLGGYFWFGMIALMGPQQAKHIEQLPQYVQYRMRTDVHRGYFQVAGEFDGTPANRADNWIHLVIEGFSVTFLLASIAVRRASKAYCEKCHAWMSSSTLRFAPGRGQTIAEWLDAGELDQLSLLPTAVASNRSASTKVSLEFCRNPRSACQTYLSAKEMRGAKAEHQSGRGRTVVPRSALTESEVATLRPMFNLGTFDSANDRETNEASPTALIEVTPIPPQQARRVLNKTSIGIGTVLTLSPVLLFWVAIGGFYFFITWSQIGGLIERRPVELQHVALGVCGLVGCLLLGGIAGYIGLKNSGMIGNRFLRLLARRSFASRRDSIVDFSRRSPAPIFFVQLVPRENWGRHMMETATDTGFMQIDIDAGELRFEGDVNRMRIPGAAISFAAVEHYTSEMGKTSLMYSVVTLRGRTAKGPIEAPFSLRNTDLFVKGNHRQTNADLLLSWIESIMPAAEVELVADDDSMEPSASSLVYEPAQSAAPDRRSFVQRYWLRLTIISLSVGLAVMNGMIRGKLRSSAFISARISNAMLPGARSAKGVPLRISNVRTMTALPGLQREPADPASWTVFDCTTETDPSAGFSVAVGAAGSTPGLRVQQDVILPHTPQDGQRVLDALSAATGVTVPEAPPGMPLQPVRCMSLRIGEKLSSPQTRYTVNAGSWVVDQWTVSDDSGADQLYFGYDLATGRAELSRSNQFAAANALAPLAAALRDGPRPPRSAANDSTFTDAGPSLSDPRHLDRTSNYSLAFAPGKRLALLIPGKPHQPLLGAPLPARDRTMVLADGLPGQITQAFACDPDAQNILVATHEAVSAPGARGTSQYWLIDRAHQSRREIVGPWGKLGGLTASDCPVSPDGRYAIFQGFSQQLLNPEAPADLYVYDLRTGVSKRVETSLKSQSVLAWSSASHAMLGDALDEDSADVSPSSYKADLDCEAGKTTDVTPPPTAVEGISPDSTHRFEVQPNVAITIVDLRTGRRKTLQLRSEDCPYATADAFHWVGNRYLQFFQKGIVLFDTHRMKFCARPALAASPKTFLQFSDDFQYAWVTDQTGITVYEVTAPDDTSGN